MSTAGRVFHPITLRAGNHGFDTNYCNRGGLGFIGRHRPICRHHLDTQRSQITHARRDEKMRDRKLLYGEFITEASR